jgi:DNA-binding CsgD family transcriptional regulator
MSHLVFLYDFLCYSLGGCGLLFAALTAVFRRARIERFYSAYMACFLLVLVSESATQYAANAGIQNRFFMTFVPLFKLAGTSLLIATIPPFCHAFSAVPAKRTLNVAFAAAGLLCLVLSFFVVRGIATRAFLAVIFTLLTFTIIYSFAVGFFFAEKWKRRDIPPEELDRWHRIMKSVAVLAVAFIPLFVLIDFYPELVPSFSRGPLRVFHAYPAFFLLWNAIYTGYTLPTYFAPRGTGAPGEWDFGRFGLSPREREVALLILEGLSYQESAEKLGVSLATVKTHVNRIYDKTGAGNKMELARMLRSAAHL